MNTKIKMAPSVDKGRILICIVVIKNSFGEEVKLNNRQTTSHQSIGFSTYFQSRIFCDGISDQPIKAEVAAVASAQSRGRKTAAASVCLLIQIYFWKTGFMYTIECSTLSLCLCGRHYFRSDDTSVDEDSSSCWVASRLESCPCGTSS